MDDEQDSFGNPENAQDFYDNFLGIGKRNKEKKAEKKIKKAEKQLEKGHIKAAERKLAKGTKLLNQVQKAQGGILAGANKIADINQTKDVINATLTAATESPNTAPGQIGSESGATTMPSNVAQQQTIGGSAGDISSTGSGGAIEDTDIPDGTTTTGLSTPDNPVELGGVTVSAGKTNWILIGVIIVVAIAVVIFIAKSHKKK
jgi:hypothetical protein